MIILIYSEKKIIGQLVAGHIEHHFKSINYSNEIFVKQVDDLGTLDSLLEEKVDEYLTITDCDYRLISVYDSISHNNPLILITSVNEQKYVREKNPNIMICDSIYKLESYLDDFIQGSSNNQLVGALTKREKEILRLISKGLLNKEIANELNITERTVKNHISNIFKKINVYDRTQAAVFAIKNKIFSL